MSFNRYRVWIFAACLALSAAAGFGAPIEQTPQAAGLGISSGDLRRLLEQAIQSNDVPGMVARLVTPDGFVTASAGKRERGAEPAFRTGDSVHIGSCLKAMTATVVARLVDRGVIRWETTLAEIFPEHLDTMDPAVRGLSFEELLAHRSGLTDDVPEDLYLRVLAFQGTGRAARARFVPEYLALPPLGIRGELTYSNFGYAVAGAMLERVTGKPYHQLVRQEVFGPLGMRSARFGAPGSNDPDVIDAPRGHDTDGQPLSPAEQDDPPILGPAGTYSMTLRDWSRFAVAQMGLPVDGELLISPSSLRRMQSAFGGPSSDEQSYGLGWSITTEGPLKLVAHDGSNGAWLSRIVINPRSQRALLLSANQASTELALDAVMRDPRIAAWLTGR